MASNMQCEMHASTLAKMQKTFMLITKQWKRVLENKKKKNIIIINTPCQTNY